MDYKANFGFRATNGKCDAAELLKFEQTVPGGHLPDEHREFILQWNGGVFPEVVSFALQDGDDFDFGSTNHLYGLYDAAHQFDLRNSSTCYGFRTAVPLKYIAIGGINWDQLCISLDGDDRGWIYLWQPGEPWPDDPPTTKFLRPVASCFREFWQALYLDEV